MMIASSWKFQQQVIDVEIKSLEESLRALRQRRNTLAPISSLPTEVIAAIFYLLRGQPDIYLALPVAHVCRRWREIVLAHPLFWSHLDFTAVGPAGASEILSRAGMAPLYLEARIHRWDDARFVAFQKELQTHVSHIYRLGISAESFRLKKTLEGLVSPAPTLKHLSLSIEKPSRSFVPDTLFDATTPKLSSLELCNCNISWKSPLLKGLKNLRIRLSFNANVRPNLTDWLDALEEIPQLQSLVLHSASPSVPLFLFDVERTVTLPSLARFDISASESDCGLALAHLVLPSLTSLCVTATSDYPTVDSVQTMLPYVVQHAHGPQDTEPLQSISVSGEGTRIDIIACSTPKLDVAEWDAELSARVVLSFTNQRGNRLDDHIRILDVALTALPLDNLVAFTSPANTQLELDEHFWRRHASRWPLLKCVHLALLPARGFREVLLQDDGGHECPLLPSLTTLELINCALSARRTLRLCDTFMKRVEQGVPLEVLDVRSCAATILAVRLLSEIVVDVRVPEELETMGTEEPLDLTWDDTRTFVYDDNSGVEDFFEE